MIEFVRVEGTEYANPKVLEARLAVPTGEPLDTEKLDLGIARLYGSGEYERIDYRMVEDQKRQGIMVDIQEKAMGPNYLRFGLVYTSDFQGESTFALLMGHRRVWVDSLGAEWLNESSSAASSAPPPSSTSRRHRSDRVRVGARVVQNVPRYVFSGSQRVAEYAVQTNGVGIDLGMPFRNSGEIHVVPTYTFYKGSPTVAVPGFATARRTDAGRADAGALDNVDNAFFPRYGARANLDVFYGQRTQRLGSGIEEVSNQLARADFTINAGIALTQE